MRKPCSFERASGKSVCTGVLQVRHFPNMDVYGGCGVGGGSLVNMAMYVTPVRELLARTLPAVLFGRGAF